MRSIQCSWLLRRSRACFQSKIPFLIRKCAHLIVSAHISLHVKHLTQVCAGEKQSHLLSSTSPLWFWRRIRLVVHFRDKFLSFLCCETSDLKNGFSSQCQKEPVSFFNQYFRIFSGILAGQSSSAAKNFVRGGSVNDVFGHWRHLGSDWFFRLFSKCWKLIWSTSKMLASLLRGGPWPLRPHSGCITGPEGPETDIVASGDSVEIKTPPNSTEFTASWLVPA